MPLPDH